jgi:tetratricopeptide (TPR) repeat protein
MLIRGAAFQLRVMQGRPEEFEEALRVVAESVPDMHLWSAGLALIYSNMGRHDEAKRVLARLGIEAFDLIPRNNVWLITLALLAEACAAVKEPARAEQLYRHLLPFSELTVVSPVNGFLGPVARYLGLLARAMDDGSKAEVHLRAALEQARLQRTPPVVGVIALDLARTLAKAEQSGAAGEAGELVDEAQRLADELDFPVLAARAAALRNELPGRERPAATAPTTTPAPSTEAFLVREGEVWSFGFAGRVVRVRDGKGVRWLAVLLSSPGVDLHALDLVGGGGGPGVSGREAAEAGLEVEDSGAGVGSVLDAAAKAAYRRRLEDLREELEEAERFHDVERAARAREELQFIGRELAAAVGLGGRDRPQSSAAERARVNVTRAVRGVIRRLEREDAELGAELGMNLHTGLFCRFEPDLRRPVRWEVRAG